MIQDFFARIDLRRLESLSLEALLAVAVLVGCFFLSRGLQRFIDRRFPQDAEGDADTVRTYKAFARVLVWTPAALFVLHLFGFNMATLFATGGLFAVAAAVATRSISENLCAGLALRMARTIKTGDILETEGTMARVERIGLRTTIARTRNERYLLIPNSELVSSRITNYTYRDSIYRLDATVGVSYDSDLGQVREVLEKVCDGLEWKSPHQAPRVLLLGFGDSSVNFGVAVWIEDPWLSRQRSSQLHEAIWWALKDAGIVIAFPQLDVHFDDPAGVGSAASDESPA